MLEAKILALPWPWYDFPAEWHTLHFVTIILLQHDWLWQIPIQTYTANHKTSSILPCVHSGMTLKVDNDLYCGKARHAIPAHFTTTKHTLASNITTMMLAAACTLISCTRSRCSCEIHVCHVTYLTVPQWRQFQQAPISSLVCFNVGPVVHTVFILHWTLSYTHALASPHGLTANAQKKVQNITIPKEYINKTMPVYQYSLPLILHITN